MRLKKLQRYSKSGDFQAPDHQGRFSSSHVAPPGIQTGVVFLLSFLDFGILFSSPCEQKYGAILYPQQRDTALCEVRSSVSWSKLLLFCVILFAVFLLLVKFFSPTEKIEEQSKLMISYLLFLGHKHHLVLRRSIIPESLSFTSPVGRRIGVGLESARGRQIYRTPFFDIWREREL